MTTGRLAIPFLALLLLAAVSWSPADARTAKRTITLSASGHVVAQPDMASISTGVLSEAKTAREALDANTKAMARVIKGLKAHKISAKDIQTSDFQVRPNYQNYRDGRPREIIGYRVSNSVHIRVRDLERLGEILDMVVTLGSNQIGGIAFEIKDAATLRDQARSKAMANATARAKLYAEAAGAQLGQVLKIEEETVRPIPGRFMMRSALAAKAAPAPIEAGMQSIEVRVHVTWSLR